MTGAAPLLYDKYQLLELIARGGMAEVYKAKSHGVEGFEKLVVIKRILPELSQHADFVDMFINEAKIAVTLSHANIVQVFDLGKSDDSYFIAMEYVHGLDLARVLSAATRRGERIPPELAVYVLSEVAKGLDYAHRRKDQDMRPLGIVHRDISPQNVLVSYEGEVKIADFGIARARGTLGSEDGSVKGKSMYMAPEQARGGIVDRRADIYAAGVVLYEVLAGRNPFGGGTEVDVIIRVQEASFPPLRSLAPEVPEELAGIVARAMAFSPEDRQPDAGQLYEDLIAFLYTTGRRVGVHDLAQFLEGLRSQAEAAARARAAERSLRAAFGDAGTGTGVAAPRAVITRVEVPPGGTGVAAEDTTGARRLPTERRDVTALAVEMLGAGPPPGLMDDLRAMIEESGGRVAEAREDFFVALFGLDRADGRDTESALEAARDIRRVVDAVREHEGSGVEAGIGIAIATIVTVAEGVPVLREDDLYLDLITSVRALATRSRAVVGVSGAVRGVASERYLFEDRADGLAVLAGRRRMVEVYGRFVGRSDVLRRIGEQLARASRGSGGAVVLAGEPGTGKTRLLHETRTRLAAGGHEFNWYQVACAPHLSDVPLSGLNAMFRALLGLAPGDSRSKMAERVERVRELGLGTAEVEAIRQLVGLPTERMEESGELSRTVRIALKRAATKLSEDRLTVLVWDAAEKLDAESAAALADVVREAEWSRLIVVLACRPPSDFGWPLLPNVAEVLLGPLSDGETTKLALSRLQATDVPLALLNEVSEKTAGNPLFVEELVKALLASGAAQVVGRRVEYRPEVAAIGVPKSLRGLLGARVERLAPARRGFLQRAAILAPRFDLPLLASVAGTTEQEAEAAVADLVREGILERKRTGDLGFVNDMLRDVVYDGITFPDRREIHGQVASQMERLHAGRLHEVHESLAIHYRESGQRDKATEFLVLAGDKLAGEHAHESALAHYLRAVDLLQNVPQPDLTRILDVYQRVGRAAMASGKIEVGLEKMRLAIDLAEHVSAHRALAGLLTLAGRLLAKATRFGEAQQYFAQALEVSEELTDEHMRRDVLGSIGEALSRNGEYRQATQYLEEALVLARIAGDRRREAGLLRELSHCWAARGQRERALEAMQGAAEAAAAAGDPLLECEVVKSRGLVYYMLREDEAALEAFNAALEMAKEYAYPYEIAVNSHNLGDLQIRTGDYRGAFTHLRFSHEVARQNGFEKLEALNMTLLGFIDAVTFGSDEGLRRIESALEFAESHGYTWDLIQAKYYLGRACLELGQRDRARAVLREAVSLSRATDNLVYLEDCETLLEGLGAAEPPSFPPRPGR